MRERSVPAHSLHRPPRRPPRCAHWHRGGHARIRCHMYEAESLVPSFAGTAEFLRVVIVHDDAVQVPLGGDSPLFPGNHAFLHVRSSLPVPGYQESDDLPPDLPLFRHVGDFLDGRPVVERTHPVPPGRGGGEMGASYPPKAKTAAKGSSGCGDPRGGNDPSSLLGWSRATKQEN